MASAVRKYGEKAVTQELRLTSNDDCGRFHYALGAYYTAQDRFATQTSYLRGSNHWWVPAYPTFPAPVISAVHDHSTQPETSHPPASSRQLTWPATAPPQSTP